MAADDGWKSVRSVGTYLTELQDNGYLTVQQRWRNDRGRARSLYILEWEENTSSPAADVEPTAPPITAGQTPAQNAAQGPRPTLAPNVPKDYLQKNGFPDRGDYNQVANYALTETSINISISQQAPDGLYG